MCSGPNLTTPTVFSLFLYAPLFHLYTFCTKKKQYLSSLGLVLELHYCWLLMNSYVLCQKVPILEQVLPKTQETFNNVLIHLSRINEVVVLNSFK